ncbi:MAG TPA: hypothetical protein DER68_01590 [Ruminococcaceae bacterium]|nr:hypothetical protein [Oscillospiraceae bacterium]
MKKGEKSTKSLLEMIKTDPEVFIDNLEEKELKDNETMFIEFFYRLLEKNKLTIKQLVYKTTISQSYLYQIASKKRRLGRDTAIILAFAMKLSFEETQKLLKYSNNAVLYPKVRRDAIIICCIDSKMTFEQANEILLEKSEKGLVV